MGVALERRNVHIFSSELRNVHNGCFHADGRWYRRKGGYRCTSTFMEGKRSAQSSVISVRLQPREYSRRTRRADDEHCLLLVWIGLEARLVFVIFCEGQR